MHWLNLSDSESNLCLHFIFKEHQSKKKTKKHENRIWIIMSKLTDISQQTQKRIENISKTL